MYLIKANPFKHALEKKIYNRSCTIPKMYIGREVFIYSGKR